MGVTRWAPVLLYGLFSACARPAVPVPSPPPTVLSHSVQPEALAQAVAAWHNDDDIEPLATYIRDHNREPEAALWREVVALHAYQSSIGVPESTQQQSRLGDVAHEFSDTVAGQVATATVLEDALSALRDSLPGPMLIDFLSGGEQWCRAVTGGKSIRRSDVDRLREVYGPPLREALGAELKRDRCRDHLQYCLWWISQYPDDPDTATFSEDVERAWYERAHPRWQSRRHAQCAYHCARTCRPKTTASDDSCWTDCSRSC